MGSLKIRHLSSMAAAFSALIALFFFLSSCRSKRERIRLNIIFIRYCIERVEVLSFFLHSRGDYNHIYNFPRLCMKLNSFSNEALFVLVEFYFLFILFVS